MRVMVMVKATADSEADFTPPKKLLEAMDKFTGEMAKAGVLIDGEGLRPSSEGRRVAYDGARRRIIDGPFAETRELVAGYWIWEVKDMAEALDWAQRCPNPMPGPSQIEIRPLYEMADLR